MGYSSGSVNLAAVALEASTQTLLTRLSAARAALLDNLSTVGGPTSFELFAVEGYATENTYYQIIAATANPMIAIALSGTLTHPTAAGRYSVYVATGAGGAEVAFLLGQYFLDLSALDDLHDYPFYLASQLAIPAGTRLAIKFDRIGGTGVVELFCGVTMMERA